MQMKIGDTINDYSHVKKINVDVDVIDELDRNLLEAETPSWDMAHSILYKIVLSFHSFSELLSFEL